MDFVTRGIGLWMCICNGLVKKCLNGLFVSYKHAAFHFTKC